MRSHIVPDKDCVATICDEVEPSTGSFQMRLLRGLHRAFPFFGLRLARLGFSRNDQPTLLQRPFFDEVLVIDVTRSQTHQLLYLQGETLVHERDLLRGLLNPGNRVVDVGANIGYYAIMFHSAVGESGQIICIEPSPENLKELRRNVAVNHFANVIIHDCAVGDEPARVGLKNGINSGVVKLGNGSYDADLVRLDDLIHDRIDFVKIDVDGYELNVLKGALRILSHDRPVVFLEFHPELVQEHGGSFSAVRRLLGEYYTQFEYYDVPEHQTLFEKIRSRYSRRGFVRRFDAEGIPEQEMHIGRTFGTFWMVCRP